MTTVEYRIATDSDDGWWYSSFSNSDNYLFFGAKLNSFMLFLDVTIPDGASIVESWLTLYRGSVSGTPPECSLYAEDAADPSVISSESDGNSRSLTSNSIPFTYQTGTGGTPFNSGSLNDILSELLASNSYAGGANIQLISIAPQSTYEYGRAYSRKIGASYSALLHIEYTEAAAGGSLIIPSHRRRFQTLSVR